MKRAVSLILTLALVLALGPSAAAYSAAYGARNLRRLIQKELEDAIAERIIGSWQHPGSRINVSSDGESLILTTV